MLAEEVRRLGDEVGVPRGLGALGVTDEDIPNLAELTLGDACLTTNPRLTSVERRRDDVQGGHVMPAPPAPAP